MGTKYRALATALILCVGAASAQDVTISVKGGDSGLKKLLKKSSLALSLSESEDAHTSQDYIAGARADYKRLLTSLYTQGYYSGQISIKIDGHEAATIPPLNAPKTIRKIAISVDPGPRFKFGTAKVAPLAPDTTLPDNFAKGKTAKTGLIQDAAKDAVTAWRDASHAKAKVQTSNITANHPARTVNADIAIAPGPALRFGELSVTGTTKVSAKRIVQIAGLPTGEAYSPHQLDLAANRLRRTGTFQSVSMIEADAYTPDLRLPFTAQIADRKPRRIGAGVEYSNLDGLTVSAFWLHRNFLGGAEQFRVSGKVAGMTADWNGVDYKLAAEFSRPGTFGPENTFFATAKADIVNDPNLTLKGIKTEIGMRRIVDENFTISAGLGLEHAAVTDDLGKRQYTIFTLPIESSLDNRDNDKDPRSGYYIHAKLTPFLAVDGVDNGVRAYGDGRYYLSFGENDRVTLAARAQLGSVIGPDLADAPADYLFFSGGGGTVRGQKYQSLGVTLPSGQTVGGRSFAGASLEARIRTGGSLGFVGFYDIGYVGADATPMTNGNYQDGVGLGVRYDTTLGPIRFDVATPASGDNAGKNVQLYIGIGQAF